MTQPHSKASNNQSLGLTNTELAALSEVNQVDPKFFMALGICGSSLF